MSHHASSPVKVSSLKMAGHPDWREQQAYPASDLPLVSVSDLILGQCLLVPAKRLITQAEIKVVRDGKEIKTLDLYGYCHTVAVLKVEREGARVYCYVAKIASFSEMNLKDFVNEQRRSSKVRYKDNIPLLPANFGPVDFPHVRLTVASLPLQRQVYIDIRELWKIDSADLWPMFDLTGYPVTGRLPADSVRLNSDACIDSLERRGLTMQRHVMGVPVLPAAPVAGRGHTMVGEIGASGGGVGRGNGESKRPTFADIAARGRGRGRGRG